MKYFEPDYMERKNPVRVLTIFFVELLRSVLFKKQRIGNSNFLNSLYKRVVLLVLFVSFALSSFGATFYWRTAAGNGNWSSLTAWSTVSAAGASSGTIPGLGDDVVISRNGSLTVTLDGTYFCNSLLINYTGITGGNLILQIPASTSLTVTNTITYTNAGDGGENASINVSGGTLSCANLVFGNTGGSTVDSFLQLSDANSIVNVSGNITMSGTDARETYLLFTANGRLNLSGGFVTNGFFTSTPGGGNPAPAPTTGTINYNNTGPQTVWGATYYNLILSGSGTKTLQAGTTTIGGNLTLNGTASATTVVGLTIGGNLNISDGTTFTAAGFALTVTGTTNVGTGTSGNITISNAAGAKRFTGLVTVNTGATWNNSGNSAIEFRGGITNNGTFTAGTGIQSFTTNAQALNGGFTIPSVTVTAITLTNNNSLTVNTALAGVGGTLTQAAFSNLDLGFTGVLGIATLNASANENTVNYNFAGVQTIKILPVLKLWLELHQLMEI
jgi:hypothetical protein